ncbi:MAG: hypothetical protein J5761_04115 [Paludibacteraceae bacterium]|nr:hypothetical protein [Paludibacteraceae bacterium]
MQQPIVHTDSTALPDNPLELLLRGMAGLVHEKETERNQLQERCSYLEQQAQSEPRKPIVADGKQNELIAALNVLYEAGFIANCSKAEFMKRTAEALGVPAMANNYAKALYNIKLTYKYDEIFSKLNEVAQTEKKK